jgi:hypothetical protein
MKTHGAMEVYLHTFLTSGLDGVEWLVSDPGRFITREVTPSTYWMGGWVNPRFGLDAVPKRNIPAPAENRIPVVQPWRLFLLSV